MESVPSPDGSNHAHRCGIVNLLKGKIKTFLALDNYTCSLIEFRKSSKVLNSN